MMARCCRRRCNRRFGKTPHLHDNALESALLPEWLKFVVLVLCLCR
jgi:hypothetical protein